MEVITDQNYLPTLLKLLSGAKKKIDILSFSFAIGRAGGKINFKSAPYEIAKKIKDIKEKNSKIKIRLFTEGLRETVDRNKVTADFLEEAGVEVVYGSTHDKGFCIYNEFVLFGSTNLSHQRQKKRVEFSIYFFNHREIEKAIIRSHESGRS